MRTTVTDPRIRDSSLAELELSLLFMQWEEDHWFSRWDHIFGTVWTNAEVQALAAYTPEADGEKTLEQIEQEKSMEDPNATMRYPLSLLIRPELLQTLRDKVIPPTGTKPGMGHIPADAISLSDVTKAEYMRKMGAISVAGDPTIRGGVDPLGASQRPQGGFIEGAPRRLGGR